MFFTLRYHPDDKHSEDAERIRVALRQRGFEWDEVAEEKDDVFGQRTETVLDTQFFYPSGVVPAQVETLLSHISFVNGKWFYDGIEKDLYDQQQKAEFNRALAAGELEPEEIRD